LTGDLAAGRTAEAVGDDEQMAIMPFVAKADEGVFVVLPLKACVSAVSNGDLWTHKRLQQTGAGCGVGQRLVNAASAPTSKKLKH
jgi:hypothetical protein